MKPTIDRLLSFRELQKYVPASRTSIWRLCKFADFPKSRRLGPGKGKNYWVESEIQAWIASRESVNG
jgi:predicted DNA-binding transcriptional regulator AlpA